MSEEGKIKIKKLVGNCMISCENCYFMVIFGDTKC